MNFRIGMIICISMGLTGMKSYAETINECHIRWGNGVGECGLWQYSDKDDPSLKGQPPCGPRSFAVDEKGSIYVLDTVNERVNTYSPDGTFVSSFFASAHHTDIVVTSSDEKIYLLSSCENMVRRYSLKGELEKEIVLPEGKGIFTSITEESKRVIVMSNKNRLWSIDEKAELKRADTFFSGLNNGYRYRVMPGKAQGRFLLKITGTDKGTVEEVEISSPRPISNAKIVGIVPEGVVLFLTQFCSLEKAVELKTEAKDMRYFEIRGYDNNGRLNKKVTLPPSSKYFTLPERKVVVRDQQLYYLVTKKEGAHIFQEALR